MDEELNIEQSVELETVYEDPEELADRYAAFYRCLRHQHLVDGDAALEMTRSLIAAEQTLLPSLPEFTELVLPEIERN